MSAPNNGGPAFPLGHQLGAEWCHDGMTLRDWFASQALASSIHVFTLETDLPRLDYKSAARSAYLLADAMLAERAKEAK